jgi:hypothetical protein
VDSGHLEEIISFVADTLRELPGSGAVHRYEPVATQAQDIPRIFGGSGSINAWSVTVTRSDEEPLSNIEVVRKHTITFRLYREVLDASISEPQARALSEAGMAALRRVHRLVTDAGTEIAEQVWPPQRPRFGHTLLGATLLCHYAEHTILMQERVRYQS